MKKLSKTFLALSAIALIAGPASASNTTTYGNVSGLFAGNGGAVMFYDDAPRSALPACQPANISQRWAIDASTVAGQAAVALLLNAYNRGKTVFVSGTGTCSIWVDTETIMYIVVSD